VVVIPTNREMRRLEYADVVYRTEREKYFAVADEIKGLNETQRPVLVGTTSIEKSERISELLKKKGVKHVVLNAKYHEREAEIVSPGGSQEHVTIRHQHGRPRNRHPAGRYPDFNGQAGAGEARLAQASTQERVNWRPRAADASMTRFYYQGAEFETPTASWTEVFERHKR